MAPLARGTCPVATGLTRRACALSAKPSNAANAPSATSSRAAPTQLPPRRRPRPC